MYAPQHFQPDDETTRTLLEQAVAGHLVTSTSQGPMATMLPLAVDRPGNRVLAHMARQNLQWQTPWHGEALIIVQGPHAYVSPSWYPSKAEHGRVVPTWNYVVMHITGTLRVHEDTAWVSDAVRFLTERHEQQRENPWSIDDAPPAYLAGQLRAIVGIEVELARVEASVKMSQNKSAADYAGVVAGLTAQGDRASGDVAAMMQHGVSKSVSAAQGGHGGQPDSGD